MKSPFKRETSLTPLTPLTPGNGGGDELAPSSLVVTPRSVSTLDLPEALLDWKAGRNRLPKFAVQRGNGSSVDVDQVDGTMTTKITNELGEQAEPPDGLQQNVKCQVISQSSTLPDRRPPKLSEAERSGLKPIISFPSPALGTPRKVSNGRGSPGSTGGPNKPLSLSSLLRNGNSLSGGEIIKVHSHKRLGEAGVFLYEILWRSHDNNIPPMELWVRSDDFLDAGKKIALEEYHKRNKLGPVAWPKNHRKKHLLRTSGSLGVKEIKDALDGRKQTLVNRGKYDDRAAELLGKCRWMMRNEWQQRGRGWAAGIDVAERWRAAWENADAMEQRSEQKTIAADSQPTEADESDRSQKPQPAELEPPPVKCTDGSPEVRHLDGGQLADPLGHKEARKGITDKFKSTAKDEEEWRGFFGEMGSSEPIMVDFTDDSSLGGISQLGGITTSFPKAVETWRINHPASLTPQNRGGKAKGEFVNLLKRDSLARKSLSAATSTPVSVHSVSEASAHLAEERDNLFSRLFPNRKTDKLRGSKPVTALSVIHSPLLQSCEVTELQHGLSRFRTTPLDGESGEGFPAIEGELSRNNLRAAQAEIVKREVRTKTPTAGSPTRVTAQHDGAASAHAKANGCSLDEDWRVRFLERFSSAPGLSKLLAGARAYSEGQGRSENREPEATSSAQLPFGVDGARTSRLFDGDSIAGRLKDSRNVLDADTIRLQKFRREREKVVEEGIAEAAALGILPDETEPPASAEKRKKGSGAAATYTELELLVKDPAQRTYREERIVKKLLKRREKEDKEIEKLKASLEKRLRHKSEKERCKELHERRHSEGRLPPELRKEYSRLKKKVWKREGWRIFLETHNDPYIVAERQRMQTMRMIDKRGG